MDPLRISMVGLSQWESVFVQTTVDLASGIDIASWRFVRDPETADVLLVDADRDGRQAEVGNGSTNQRPIVVSFSGDAVAKGRGLVRPVTYADLVAMLRDIESEIAESPGATTPEIAPTPKPAAPPASVVEPEPDDDAAPPAENAADDLANALKLRPNRNDESLTEKTRQARRFVEGTRMIGILKQVVAAGRNVQVRHRDYPSILVFPEFNAYSASANSLAIPRLYRSSSLAFEVRPVTESRAANELASDRCRPLGRLIYCAALFGSEGRLPLNVDPNDLLRLNNWPDFDGVPHLPEHKTIAKYLLVHSARLGEIATATGVNLDKIIDFVNACEAAGLLVRITADGVAQKRDTLIDRMRGFFRN